MTTDTNTNTKATATSWPSAVTIPRNFFSCTCTYYMFSFSLFVLLLFISTSIDRGLYLIGFERHIFSCLLLQRIETHEKTIRIYQPCSSTHTSLKTRYRTQHRSNTNASIENGIGYFVDSSSKSVGSSTRH